MLLDHPSDGPTAIRTQSRDGSESGLLTWGWCVSISVVPYVCDPRFEPVSTIWLPTRSNSHSVVARGDRTRIPLATDRLERTGPFFVAAFEAKQSIGSSTRIGRG